MTGERPAAVVSFVLLVRIAPRKSCGESKDLSLGAGCGNPEPNGKT